MSGTNTTAPTPSGVPISSLPAADAVTVTDGVFGVFAGKAQLADPKTLVAAGLPSDVVKTGDLHAALSNSALGQYTDQAAKSATSSAADANRAETAQAASSASADKTAQTGVQVAAIAESAKTNNDAAQQAVTGVTGTANLMTVLLTAALAGEAPGNYRGYWNAATNSPALTSGSGTEGDLYIVSVAGTTLLDGNAQWGAQDAAWFHNGAWQYFARAGWPAFARVISAAERLSISGVAGLATHQGGFQWAICDALGFVGGGLDAEGNFLFPSTEGTVGPLQFSTDNNGSGLLVVDEQGFVGFDGGNIFTGEYVAPVFSADELSNYDRSNRAFTDMVWRSGWLTGQRPVCDYNGVLSLGQSEQNGEMSLPLLPYLFSSASVGAFMVGGSARCTDPNDTASAWEPVGGSSVLTNAVDVAWNIQTNTEIAPNDLIGTVTPSSVTVSPYGVTITSNDASVDFTKIFRSGQYVQFSGFTGEAAWMNYPDAPEAVPPSGATSFGGQNYVQLTAVTTTDLTLQYGGTPGTYTGVTIAYFAPVEPTVGQDQTLASVVYEGAVAAQLLNGRKLVVGNACIGGQTLAQLSPGSTPNLFQRVGQWAAHFVSAVTAKNETASSCVHVLSFGQGGSDNTTDYNTYIAELAAYISAARNAVMAQTGQTLEPFFEGFVISGGNIPPADNLGVSRAQIDLICGGTVSNAYLVGPGYFVPDYYAHWSSNGERWFGNLRAKIRKWVVYEGRGWQPCRIIGAVYRGAQIVINCHVPFAPLQVKSCYVGQSYELLKNYGFSVYDSVTGAQLEIQSVTVGPTYLVLNLAGAPLNPPRVKYAEWMNGFYGSGNICDSDPSVAYDSYSYSPGTGQPLTENQPELIGKPYPLNNWLCPYSLIAEEI